MTEKLPSIQFYPGDWRKDPGVQALSFHDRGIWFELLLIMHESNDRGKLLLDGKAFPEDGLARLLGLDKQILTTTLTTLLTYGVASIDPETGALMNRRMVRDEEIRKIRTKAGKMGGNPLLLKQKPTTQVNQKSTPSSSSSPSKIEISKKIEISPPVGEKAPEEIEDKNKILKQEQIKMADEAIDMLNAAGKRSFRKSAQNRGYVIARLNQGFTLEDIKTVLDYKRTDSYFTIERPDLYRPQTLFGSNFESYLQAARMGATKSNGKDMKTAKQMAAWKPPEERNKEDPI